MVKKLIFILTLLAAVLTSCTDNPRLSDKTTPVSFDLDSIRQRGKLIAVTDYNSTYYPAKDINTPVSFPQNLAWGLMKTGSDKLLGELNSWIYSFRKTGSNALLYARMKFILAAYNAGPGHVLDAIKPELREIAGSSFQP